VIRVSLVAVPEAMVATLFGPFEVLASAGVAWYRLTRRGREQAIFRPEIVAASTGPVLAANGVPVHPHCSIDAVDRTDIVLVPSLQIVDERGIAGGDGALVEWMREMHARGATLCSVCSGSLLVARTGLLDGERATIHWAFVDLFRRLHPQVDLRPEKFLVASGDGDRLVTAGGGAVWHDLVLYILARFAGPAVAAQAEKVFLLQRHPDTQLAFASFRDHLDHGDRAIRDAQRWLAENSHGTDPLVRAAQVAGLPARTFQRRFKQAAGLAPIAYLQNLRIERARERLETTDLPIEEIGASIGYADNAAFRRVFKRVTGMTPGAYRRRFRVATA